MTKVKNMLNEYMTYFHWQIIYESFLTEIGDLNNIKILKRKSKHQFGFAANYVYEIPPNDELAVIIQDITADKDKYSKSIIGGADSVVNISFLVNDKDTGGLDTDLSTFNRIMKSVQESVIEYLNTIEPDIILVSSQLPDLKNVEADEKRKREEQVKIHYYKGFIRHLTELVKSKGYEHEVGPAGPFSRNAMYMYKPKIYKN